MGMHDKQARNSLFTLNYLPNLHGLVPTPNDETL